MAIPEYITHLKKMKGDERSGDNEDNPSSNGLREELTSVRTERDGFLDVIDALTSGNPAITLAARGTLGSLPLHIVRYLELMPWEKNAQDYASAFDEVSCFNFLLFSTSFVSWRSSTYP